MRRIRVYYEHGVFPNRHGGITKMDDPAPMIDNPETVAFMDMTAELMSHMRTSDRGDPWDADIIKEP
jgi:hypothetical protein